MRGVWHIAAVIYLMLLLGGIVVVGGILVASYYSVRAKLIRRFRSVELVALETLQEGQVARLTGAIEYLDGPLETPVTGRPCACYEVVIEERRSDGNGRHAWSEVGREVKWVDAFYLRGVEGVHGEVERAVVQVQNPTVLINSDQHTTSGFLDDPTPRESELAARLGAKTVGFIFNKTLRYREGVIEEGELVTVVGKCVLERDPTPGARGGYRGQVTRKRIVAPDGEAMLLSDEPETQRYR